MIFNLSITIPWFLSMGVVDIITGKVKYGIFFLSVTAFVCLIQMSLLRWNKKNLMPKNINVASVNPTGDNWLVIYIVSYILPFLETIKETNFSYVKYISIGVLLLSIIMRSNSSVNNPYLLLLKYHIYDISDENGIQYILLSKKKIRNKNHVKKVWRIMEYVLMEVDNE